MPTSRSFLTSPKAPFIKSQAPTYLRGPSMSSNASRQAPTREKDGRLTVTPGSCCNRE